MLPLTRQVQIACDIAKNSVARLAGQEPPRFEDNETTFEQLRARIARTLDYMKQRAGERLRGHRDARRSRCPPVRTARSSSRDWSFCSPGRSRNVFFHVTTAYNILRHNGVELGKRDFIGGGREL